MRIESRSAVAGAALALALAPVVGCGRGSAATAAVAGGSAQEVLAQVNGVSVTREQLDRKTAPRLAALRQQEYEIRRQVLEDLVDETLFAREATSRGIATEALLKAEVEDKAKAPTQGEVESLYRQHAAQLAGRPRDEAMTQVEQAIRDRSLAARREAYRQELRNRSEVRIALKPPRFEVPVPASAPALGPASAKVTIVAFSDYQCPYCKRAQGAVDAIMSEYKDKIRLVHRDYPIDGHPRAFPASRAARCAGDQGHFWEYHRGLLTAPGDFSDEDLKARAQGLQLDVAAFSTCVASDRHDAAIRESVQNGNDVGVSGTPTYFINGRMLVGIRSVEQLKELINDELTGSSSSS